MHPTFDYDLVVIGGGSGGVRAARISANLGARVAIAEEDRYGGTCVVRGCIPKKLMVYASEFAHSFEDAAGYGWTVPPPSFDWLKFRQARDAEIDRLTGIYARNLDKAGVTRIAGHASFVDGHTLEIAGQPVTAAHILIAVGGRPWKPAFEGSELSITSDEVFHLPQLPKHITVIGGGYIGVEFASIFRGLGSEVALVHRGPAVLSGFDTDLRAAADRNLAADGIELHLSQEISSAQSADGRIRLNLRDGQTWTTDALMCATGRIPNTESLELIKAGVHVADRGAVVVDEYSRTSVPHIYAVGDCTDRVNLTPVAIREGQAFADTVFGDRPTAVDHRVIPTAVFGQPPIASVGKTEEEAVVEGSRIHVYRSEFRPLLHTLSGRDQKMLMKVIVDAESDKVLGVHMVGKGAAEIIQTAAIAVTMGATKADFDATIALHPTSAEELVLMKTPAHSRP